ncbi:heparan-alpha-glucosaminide N-acetyltransferase domain-containing protein [Bacterioplanoides sp.]|uniref:heparan-alpha-glucosaminide N-acetyltransferase domain-containing protein n=1 Tax=Bacterioplanoides sp. TaxID=2066072 RepID=UPI003B5AD020
MNASLPQNAQVLNAGKSRIKVLDFYRGICVMFMLVVHFFYFYGAPEFSRSPIGLSFELLTIWIAAFIYLTSFMVLLTPSATGQQQLKRAVILFLGGYALILGSVHGLDFKPEASHEALLFSVCCFVFLMGIFIAIAGGKSLSTGIKRGLILFVAGYALNFFRSSVPMWLSLQLGLVSAEDLGGDTPLTELLVVDILQFAGIAFIICSLLRHYLPQPKYWIGLALIIAFASPYAWDAKTGNYVADELLKLLAGNISEGAFFPQLPWLAYALTGMAFGHWMKQADDLNSFLKKSAWYSLAAIVIGGGIILTNMDYHTGDSMRAGPGAVIAISGITALSIFLFQGIVEKIPDNPVFRFWYSWSKHITTIYVVHWLLIGWGLMYFGFRTLSGSGFLITLLALYVLTHFLATGWARFKPGQNK